MLKESLLVLGLGVFLLGTIGRWPDRLAWRPLVAIVLGLAVMLVVKFYVLMCLLPGLIARWWSQARPGRPLTHSIIVHALALVGVLLSGSLVPGYDILDMLTVKQHDFIGMATDVESGSLLAMPTLDGSLASFIRCAPHALYMSFLSPFAVMDTGALAWMSAAENVLLLVISLVALWYRREWRTIDRPAFWFLLSFILLLALLIGWTVPVVGALVRYRLPMLPFVALLALIILDPKRLPRWLPLGPRP